MGNIAYIDNQNLYMSAKHAPESWTLDMRKFRVYLKDKFDVEVAYLFMGAFDDSMQETYQKFQHFGYVLVWRVHGVELKGIKKGNVNTDIVFYMMRDLYECDKSSNAVLVSGDGDYYRTIDYLLNRERLEKVILPSRHNASSLYKSVPETYKMFLDNPGLKKKIERRHKNGAFA